MLTGHLTWARLPARQELLQQGADGSRWGKPFAYWEVLSRCERLGSHHEILELTA